MSSITKPRAPFQIQFFQTSQSSERSCKKVVEEVPNNGRNRSMARRSLNAHLTPRPVDFRVLTRLSVTMEPLRKVRRPRRVSDVVFSLTARSQVTRPSVKVTTCLTLSSWATCDISGTGAGEHVPRAVFAKRCSRCHWWSEYDCVAEEHARELDWR